MELSDIVGVPLYFQKRTDVPKKKKKSCQDAFTIFFVTLHTILGILDTTTLILNAQEDDQKKCNVNPKLLTEILILAFCGYLHLLMLISGKIRQASLQKKGLYTPSILLNVLRFIVYIIDFSVTISLIVSYYQTSPCSGDFGENCVPIEGEEEEECSKIELSCHLVCVTTMTHMIIFYILISIIGLFLIFGIVICMIVRNTAAKSEKKKKKELEEIENRRSMNLQNKHMSVRLQSY